MTNIDSKTNAALSQAAPADLTDEQIIDVLWDAMGRDWKPEHLPEPEDRTGYFYKYRQLISAFRILLARAAVVAISAPAVPYAYSYVHVDGRRDWRMAGSRRKAEPGWTEIAMAEIGAAPAAQSQPAGAPTRFHIKDHVVRDVVNDLRERASLYTAAKIAGNADWGQLRTQMREAIEPLLVAAQPAGAGAPSIDTPEFRGLLEEYDDAASNFSIYHARAALIAHIDAQLARQGAAPAQAEPVARPIGWLDGSSSDGGAFMHFSKKGAQQECDEHNAYERSRPDFDESDLRTPEPVYATAPAHAGVAQADTCKTCWGVGLVGGTSLEDQEKKFCPDCPGRAAIQASTSNTGSER